MTRIITCAWPPTGRKGFILGGDWRSSVVTCSLFCRGSWAQLVVVPCRGEAIPTNPPLNLDVFEGVNSLIRLSASPWNSFHFSLAGPSNARPINTYRIFIEGKGVGANDTCGVLPSFNFRPDPGHTIAPRTCNYRWCCAEVPAQQHNCSDRWEPNLTVN